MGEVLVIGYGNTLRRDDAVGPLSAEEVSRWGRPGVVPLDLAQLLPELAERLSRA
jgi:hydrogenase maturation protease